MGNRFILGKELIMKQLRLFTILSLVAGLLTSGIANADRGHWGGHSHVGIGFYFGAPYYPYPYYAYPYAYPYPYYPPVVVAPQSPPAYIEQGDQEQSAQQDNYWYHCASPEGYYPYVKKCPGGWEKVIPEPPK
jgi:hypothetical protein